MDVFVEYDDDDDDIFVSDNVCGFNNVVDGHNNGSVVVDFIVVVVIEDDEDNGNVLLFVVDDFLKKYSIIWHIKFVLLLLFVLSSMFPLFINRYFDDKILCNDDFFELFVCCFVWCIDVDIDVIFDIKNIFLLFWRHPFKK